MSKLSPLGTSNPQNVFQGNHGYARHLTSEMLIYLDPVLCITAMKVGGQNQKKPRENWFSLSQASPNSPESNPHQDCPVHLEANNSATP